MDFKGKQVLVTGGAGFIGSHLVDRLVAEGADVTVLDDLSYGRAQNLNPRARFLQGDIRDYDRVREAVRGQRLVFHLAACATTKESAMGWADPVYDYQVNALGTLNVLRAVAEAGSGASVVYASSAAVYGHIRYTPIDEAHPTEPLSPYGVSKLAGEKYCLAFFREHGIPVVILRIFNCYGPRQPRYVMHDFIMKLQRDPSMLSIIGDGRQARDFCYVDDVIDAFLLACQSHGETFNIATGVPTTVMAVAEAIRAVLSPEARIVSEGSTWRGDIPVLLGDASRLRALGFAPKVDLATGIRRLVASYGIPVPVGR